MDTKLLLTRQFLKELNLNEDEKNIKKYLHKWWKNARLNGERSFALTDEGFDIIQNKIGLKFYQIDLPVNTIITPQLLIWLDRFIDCPYYLNEDSIMVSREKIAVQLILFGGDLMRYGRSKMLSKNLIDK